MIDVQLELQSAKIGFESKYITLFDVIEALKNESDATYSEIAQYLLLKFLPYEPLRNIHFEMDTGLDSYQYFQFTNPDYLMPYKTPGKLYYVSIEHLYFEEVKDALKMLEIFNYIPAFNAAITSRKQIVEYKNNTYDSNPFSMSGYKSICFEIEDMKRILGLDFSEYKAKGVIIKIENYCNDSLTDDVSYLGSSPIENSIEIIPQNEEIARLKAEIAELKKTETEQSANNAYEGEIPPQTDKDKLAHFIKLIIQRSEFMKDGKLPTYSELYTMLSHKFPNERIPSKNTINKYLNP